MAMSEIDIRKRNDLDDALTKVDRIVMHKYISELDKCPIFLQTYDVVFSAPEEEINAPVCIVGTNIMLLKLTRVVFDKDENVLDKLTTAYNATALYESATLVMLIKSNGKQIEVYLGTVCKKSDDPFVPQKQVSAFKSNIEANFPGSEVQEVLNIKDRMKIVQSIFEKKVCVASVSGIAALKDKESNDNNKYVQGLEKLVDALKGKSCSVMIIADPVGYEERESIRSGYEEIYTALKPFEKSEYSINKANGKTVTDSVIEGVTDTTNESLAKTKTHTLTKGTNSAHTVGGSVGINTSATATAGVSVAPFGVGANASTSVSVGASVSADYHYMHGHHEDRSEAEGNTVTEGTSKSLSKQNSIANALSNNEGEGLQISYENRSIKSILERIDLQIKRISECEDFGMYDCGVYFLSEDYATCLSAASTYKSIIQGEQSSVEASHINIWDANEAMGLIPYLSTFNHPIFDISNMDDKASSSATASTLVSGKELAIYMGLPKKSISGIPVIECASFGRNVLYSGDKPTGTTIEFGNIHHMYCDEEEKVLLDKNSLTSHAFVTGSTGVGKSNAIYQLIDNICFKSRKKDDVAVHFLVIEPRKGEYKDVFGGRDGVSVYGTNPQISRLLKINPFSFPGKIHVLEHIDRLVEIFNVCWPMYAAMPAVLKEAIERAYETAGWDLDSSECINQINGSNMYPCFLDVLKQINSVIEETKYSADSKGDYVGALTMRVSSLTNGINGQILTNNELSYEELFDSNVIIDLSRVGSTETKSLIMGLLIIKLQEYRMASAVGSNKVLQHFTILEEAHNLLKRTSTEQSSDTSNLLGKSVEMLANAIAEMRTYGEGFIIVDQSPGLMDMSVIRNTNTKIILRLPDMSDRELVGKSANLNDSQIVELAKLKTGVCAVYQNNWIEPVLCYVAEWDNKKNKSSNGEKEDVFESIELKKKILKLVLKPARSKRVEDIERFNSEVLNARLATTLKLNILKYVEEENLENIRGLRKAIVYELFSPDILMEKNLCYRNEIKEWCRVMQETLTPDLSDFDEIERNKILAILAYEKNRMESKKEYEELINNLLNYIEHGRSVR